MEFLDRFKLPIKDKKRFINYILEVIDRDFKGRGMGLIYISEEDLMKMFKPHFDKIGKQFKIIRGWAHFMTKGTERTSHQHTALTGLYYLKIPENSGKLFFDDTAVFVDPIEDEFMLFDSMRPHGITGHKSDELRLAIAMELEEK